MPNVTMPNGDVVAFPDDMPREQIKGMIASKFPEVASGDGMGNVRGPNGQPATIGVNAQGDKDYMYDPNAGSIKKPTSFLGEMGANFQHGIKSARDLLTGEYEGSLSGSKPTPKTTALGDKLFPPGSDGSFMGAMRNLRNTNPSDFSGAVLEKMGETPEGKLLSAIGGIHPLYNAGSTLVNREINPAISKATGIHPDNLVLMEMGAGTLGLKTAGKTRDPIASMAKSGFTAAKNKVAASKAPSVTSAGLRDMASQIYETADKEGAVLYPASTNKFIESASKVMPQTEAGKIVTGETASTNLVGRLNGLKNKHLNLKSAQEIDSALGDAMSAEVNPLTGKLNAEGTKLLQIQNALRDTIESASQNDLVGGKTGFQTWNKGRQLWAASAKMNDVERIMARAEMTENPVTAIRTGFRALASNPSRLRGFTKAEVDAIKYAAKTGIVTGSLKILGSRLMSGVAGTTAGAAGGGMVGAPLGLIAGEAMAVPMRATANALQRGRGNAVLNTIANRPEIKGTSVAAPKAPAPGNIPAATALGGVGTAGATEQRQPLRMTITPQDKLPEPVPDNRLPPRADNSNFENAVQIVMNIEGGYVANDAGKGETNMGINANANPDLNIRSLKPENAKQRYKTHYWNAINGDKLPPELALVGFDAAVNHGVGKAREMISASNGDPHKLLQLREMEYARLVRANPKKYSQYAQGWIGRLKRLEQAIT